MAERDRIDRLPTRGERWVGGVLSALLTLTTIPAAIFVSVITFYRDDSKNVGATIAAVLWFLGISGAFLFYRICFTKARAASARAQQIYKWTSIVVGALFAFLLIKRQIAGTPSAAHSTTSLERAREK